MYLFALQIARCVCVSCHRFVVRHCCVSLSLCVSVLYPVWFWFEFISTHSLRLRFCRCGLTSSVVFGDSIEPCVVDLLAGRRRRCRSLCFVPPCWFCRLYLQFTSDKNWYDCCACWAERSRYRLVDHRPFWRENGMPFVVLDWVVIVWLVVLRSLLMWFYVLCVCF